MYKILTKHFDNKLYSLTQIRPYASRAGKTKMTKEDIKEYSKEEVNNINIHAQFVTDFNLIYEKEGEERLFVTAFLHTNKTKDSFQISNNQNYSFENKSQNITFLKKPIEVTNDIHVFKKSEEYFNKPETKKDIEDMPQYIKMKDKVIAELKELEIAVREARTPEEMDLTALNRLKKKYGITYKNEKMDTLKIS